MPDEVDGDVLERFVHGDQNGFELLFRQFEVEVYRWILRIVRDASAAEDVLVEAFWRAYRARARFDPSRSFGAWMRRIATNAALDHVRAARRRTGWTTTDDKMPAPTGPDRLLGDSIALAFAGCHRSCRSLPHLRSSRNSRTARLPRRSICRSAPSSLACFEPSER